MQGKGVYLQYIIVSLAYPKNLCTFAPFLTSKNKNLMKKQRYIQTCLLYTSDAADE